MNNLIIATVLAVVIVSIGFLIKLPSMKLNPIRIRSDLHYHFSIITEYYPVRMISESMNELTIYCKNRYHVIKIHKYHISLQVGRSMESLSKPYWIDYSRLDDYIASFLFHNRI